MTERPQRFALAVAGLVATVCLAAGCGGDGGDQLPPAQNENRGGPRASKDCNDLVQLALSSLQPEQFGTLDTSGPLTLLDGWKADCQSTETARIAEQMVGKETKRLVDHDLLLRIIGDQFSDQDAAHVRNVIQMQKSAEFAANRAEGDLERIVQVFQYVVRNVQLLEEDDPLAGLGAFEALVLGEGSARDRAWVFVDLLRQLRVDAVVLRPAGAAEGSPFLVGVLLDGKCYLFDTRLGWPVPSPEDDGSQPFVTRPATLAELRAEGELLDRFDLPDAPYPLADADLDDVDVLVAVTSSLLAPRLAGVHAILTGTTVVDSFDSPEGDLGYPNLLTRLTDNAPWKPEKLAIWEYPERKSVQTLDDMAADRRSAVLARRDQFTTKLRSGGSLLVGRLQQLRGEFDTTDLEPGAVANLSAVRDSNQQTSDAHREAARDALFWSGLCTLATGDRLAAENTLRGYVDRHPAGRYVPTARLHLAEGYVSRGGAERAAAELAAIAEDTPGRDGLALLAARWQAKTGSESGETPSEPTPEPEETKETESADDPA